jgi:AraC-like DNA-binding protein
VARVLAGEEAGRRWELARHTWPDFMRPYVTRGCGYREWTSGELVRRELPIGRIVLDLQLGPPLEIGGVAHEGGFVAGLTEAASVQRYRDYQDGLQLMLSPAGARALFGVPMAELRGRVVSFADLAPHEGRALVDRLREDTAWPMRFAHLERWLARRMQQAAPNGIVTWACSRIRAASGSLAVAELARETGYGERHLGRLFAEHVGTSPKRFARLVRFEHLVAHLRQHPRARDWCRLARQFGFADQAHLVREVRSFAGTTPTALDPILAPFAPAVPEAPDAPDGQEADAASKAAARGHGARELGTSREVHAAR